MWVNADGTPTMLARGPWAEGRGKPQGEGSRWQAWYVGDDGQRRTKKFRIKEDAKGWADKRRGEVHTRVWINPDVGADTFKVVGEQWFATKAFCKPKTVAGYRSILDTHVLPKWGDTALKDITYRELAPWIAGLGLSASRVVQVHQLVGAVFKYAVKAGLATKNPCTEFERRTDLPAPAEGKQVYLTHAELLALAGEMDRFETLTLVLGYCGLRFGEASALRRRDVGDRVLTVENSATHVAKQGIVETATKTSKVRRVPVPEPVWDVLEAELPHEPDAFVWPSRKGEHLPLGEYRWAFDNALKVVTADSNAKRAKEVAEQGKPTTRPFPVLTPHGLRHTCASLAISAGANVKVVQRLLGHATATMTLDRYGHLMSDDLAGVADQLGKAITAAAS